MTQKATAIVIEQPHQLQLKPVMLAELGDQDCVIDVEWSGISSGTERLLWDGKMPSFPGMGYPLVPGYESVGRIVQAAKGSHFSTGDRVFIPGAQCFESVRGLFGGAASRLQVPAERLIPLSEDIGENGILIALAATAHHALSISSPQLPDLIVGHGVLGRLLARIARAMGGNPVVWEQQSNRQRGEFDYPVIDPSADQRRDYNMICDASGDPEILDSLISRLGHGGQILLAGFYSEPLHFNFPPAFMREARLQIAAEWKMEDLTSVMALIQSGRLSLEGLITHRADPDHAADAYATAFTDNQCLKMIIDWRQ